MYAQNLVYFYFDLKNRSQIKIQHTWIARKREIWAIATEIRTFWLNFSYTHAQYAAHFYIKLKI